MTAVAREGVLHVEHLLLGAEFEVSDSIGVERVARYANESASDSDTVLADLTGCAYLLASDPDAEAFCTAALAGREPHVGEQSWEASLNGAGRLVSVPLVMRTGDQEHVILDASEKGDALAAWVSFLAQARSEEGVAAFPDLLLEEASGMLVPLLLAGPAAPHVLADYLHDGAELPGEGVVAQLRLDDIAAIVTRLAGSFAPSAYLLFVPVAHARILWRSLLSFTEVTPVGHHRLRSLLERMPWSRALADGAPTASRAELSEWGIVRDDQTFVGARSLG